MSDTEESTHEPDIDPRIELLNESSSWARVPSVNLTGAVSRPVPTILQRSDGKALIYPGRTHVLMGEPESCKSFIGLMAVVEQVKAGNAVVIVDNEDDPSLAGERLMQMGLTERQIDEGIYYCQPGAPFDEVAQAHLWAWSQVGREITFALIDAMTDAMSLENLDPDRGRDVSSFYRGLPKFLARDLGAGVAIIDHVVKSHESRDRWAIGSERKISGLTGAAYSFKATSPFGRALEGTPIVGTVTVTLSKDRCGYVRSMATDKTHLGTITLTSSPLDGSITTTFEATPRSTVVDMGKQLKRDEDAVLAAIDTLDRANVTQIRDTAHIDVRRVNDTITRLLEGGKIRQTTGRGKVYERTPTQDLASHA